MAIAVAATTTQTWTNSQTLTLTKPTGTTDGEVLIAVVAGSSINNVSYTSVPSGWNLIAGNSAGTGFRLLRLYYKVASSEGASWNWGTDDPTGYVAGCVLRVTGSNTDFLEDTHGVSNSATPNGGTGITPAVASSLLVMSVVASDTGAGNTIGSYTVAVSNPSWTEVIDTNQTTSPVKSFGVAYAVRPETTGTGTFGVTHSSGSSMETLLTLIALESVDNLTYNASVITTTASVVAPSVTGTANATPTVISTTAAVQAPTVSTPEAQWATQDKSSSTWTNQSKN